MNNDPIVIIAAKRSPQGNLLGELSSLTCAELGAHTIKAALQQSQVNPAEIDELYMGCVLPAGQGQAPARQAGLIAGLPTSTGATTLNKMCGSGMKAVMLAHDQLLAGNGQFILAGGMESMSQAPYLLKKARGGYRLGHGELIDHLFLDGLEDAYERGKLMGCFAEDTAEHFQISREKQDAFALASLERSIHASEQGRFINEIAPIMIELPKSRLEVSLDEGPRRAMPEKIPNLKPAFSPTGTITAANSSSISDGAAALILMRRQDAIKRGFKPLAKIVGHAQYSQEPKWFTTAPVGAINRLCEKIKWDKNRVDLYEINEAFAVVTLVAMQELSLPHDIVNIHGGACAIGHPIGASGARIIVTLLNALQQHQLHRGIAALCIGGGEATAIAIELEA